MRLYKPEKTVRVTKPASMHHTMVSFMKSPRIKMSKISIKAPRIAKGKVGRMSKFKL